MNSAGRIAATLFGLVLINCFGSAGQSLSGALTPKTATTSTSQTADILGRDNPRDSMRGFLEACHSGNLRRAEQYLDLTRVPDPSEAAQRARTLGLLLDRDAHFELEQLDNTATGHPEDGLSQDLDRLLSVTLQGRSVTLYLQREKRNGNDVWLVSADSVARLPELSGLLPESPIEKHLPAVLVRSQLLSTPVWVLLALVLFAFVISLLSRLLSRFAFGLASFAARKYLKSTGTFRIHLFMGPVRLLVGIAVFRACMGLTPPSALLRDLLIKVLAFLFMFGAAALFMRVVDLVADRYISRLNPQERAMSYSLLPLLGRFVKICIFCLALLAVLRAWGFDITAVLAGVGVGGLAVALAAQKTIENLFGGISVISDRPVLVGDFCQFGGQTGKVEDIGLRSTRIRTNDRTLVTVPNSQFSTMTLENFSRRDRFWFHPTLLLRRDTPEPKIQEAMQAVDRLLREHANVDATALPVRFTKIAPDGYVLEVFSYVLTTDATEFLRIQSELLLAILQSFSAIGVGLAVPFQESMTVPNQATT